MNNNLIISQKGIDLIKRWEGLRTYSYLCPAGVWTIGYGHTKGVKSGQVCTPLQAEQLLIEDLKLYEGGVRTLVKVKLNQNQYDALVSFTFGGYLAQLKPQNDD
jgi:lysozyme